jgi:hypothetical protein
MQSDLSHAVQFVQAAIAIILGLALGESLKQLVPDGDQDIRKDRVPLLFSFFFMIFPFFHGISRHFYTSYLTHADLKLGAVSGHVMFDGSMFIIEAGLFFVLCRSLSPTHWPRFYSFLLILLLVDTNWALVTLFFVVDSIPDLASLLDLHTPFVRWIILNVFLASVLGGVFCWYRPPPAYPDRKTAPRAPGWICAVATFTTTLISYVWSKDFYFPP